MLVAGPVSSEHPGVVRDYLALSVVDGFVVLDRDLAGDRFHHAQDGGAAFRVGCRSTHVFGADLVDEPAASAEGAGLPHQDFAGVQPAVRLGNNYLLNPSDPGIATPADFKAPSPTQRPVGGPAVDFDEENPPEYGYDGMDLDEVTKSHAILKGRTLKGLWSNIVKQAGPDENRGA